MKDFLVIGCGKFGQSVAKKLSDKGMDVLAVDKDIEKVQDVSEYVTYTIQLDATDEAAFKSISAETFEVAIVAIGENIQSSITATYMAKEMGVKRVIAKAKNDTHAKILYKVGADKVVFPERDMGLRIAYSLSMDNVLDYIEVDSKYSIIEIKPYLEWIGKTLKELRLKEEYKINIIAIKREGKEDLNMLPKGTDYINQEDIIIVLGETKELSRLGEDI